MSEDDSGEHPTQERQELSALDWDELRRIYLELGLFAHPCVLVVSLVDQQQAEQAEDGTTKFKLGRTMIPVVAWKVTAGDGLMFATAAEPKRFQGIPGWRIAAWATIPGTLEEIRARKGKRKRRRNRGRGNPKTQGIAFPERPDRGRRLDETPGW